MKDIILTTRLETTGLEFGLGGSDHSRCTLQDALGSPRSRGKAQVPWDYVQKL